MNLNVSLKYSDFFRYIINIFVCFCFRDPWAENKIDDIINVKIEVAETSQICMNYY